MAILKLTLIGLYNYDNNLFNLLPVMNGINNEQFRDYLLLKYGECGCIYTDPDYLKNAIAIWGHSWQHGFERMARTLAEEYNPLHNFDRHEEYTDVTTRSSEGSGSNTGSNGGSDVDTSMVSAFNSADFQNDNKIQTDYGSTSEGSYEDSSSEDGSLTHTGHLYGNIGTTKSTEMAKDEIMLRSTYHIYDIMADCFRKAFLTYIW